MRRTSSCCYRHNNNNNNNNNCTSMMVVSICISLVKVARISTVYKNFVLMSSSILVMSMMMVVTVSSFSSWPTNIPMIHTSREQQQRQRQQNPSSFIITTKSEHYDNNRPYLTTTHHLSSSSSSSEQNRDTTTTTEKSTVVGTTLTTPTSTTTTIPLSTIMVTVLLTRELGKNKKLQKAIEKQFHKHENDNNNNNNDNGNDIVVSSSSSKLCYHTNTNQYYQVKTLEIPCIEHGMGPDYELLRTTLQQQQQQETQLQVQQQDLFPLDEQQQQPKHIVYDYIVITSPEAARVLASVWPKSTTNIQEEEEEKKRMVQILPAIVAVGKATEETLLQLGLPVHFVPTKATAATLVQELPYRCRTTMDKNSSSTSRSNVGCHVLYPASCRAERTIQDALEQQRTESFHVTRLNTYDTITAVWNKKTEDQVDNEQKDDLKHHSMNDDDDDVIDSSIYDMVLSKLYPTNGSNQQEQELQEQLQPNHQHLLVTFASPSSIKGWLQNTKNYTNIPVACIGETSAKACKKYGWLEQDIDYPINQPGIDGWINSIQTSIDKLLLLSQQQQQ